MWMRFWLLLVAALVAFSQSPSRLTHLEDTTIGQYIRAKDSPVVKAYVLGVASGLLMLNKELERSGKRFFCRVDSAPLDPLVLLCYKDADTPEDNLEGSIVKVR